jgi:DNA-binding SARP family transcriptional activator/tetratricopeptide (TPR) repeat protein
MGLLEIRVLGPVDVVAAGVRLPAGRPQAQAVLAALAVDVPRPVPVQTLIERIWGEHPPAQARQAVWTRVAGIRKLLAEAASAEVAGVGDLIAEDPGTAGAGRPSDWLPWRSGGYVLQVDPDQVDLHRFRRLTSAARGRECPDTERVELLAEALDLWRGVPLAGLTGDWATRRRDSWQVERLEAAIAWAQAALRLGRHATAIPVLRDLAEQHPHSEPVAVTLVRALAADNRGSEAVAECRAVSDRLYHELGTTPGHELRTLQHALLNDLPLPPPVPPASPAATPVVVPAQLPADVSGFAGRVEHLSRLDALLAGTEAATAVMITVVSGTAGVGKTALAVHWAHRVAGRFPDGQLHVNLRGFDPAGQVLEAAAAVRGFLETLGVAPERVPVGFEAQVGLYRSLLAGRRVLVVVDNARDAEHARPLLPGTATALAVVTSRGLLADLVAADGAHPVVLDLLSEAESRELLERRLGRGRVAAEAAAVERIVGVCARLPLALALVAARAATHPGFGLAAVAAELADAAGRASAQGDAEDVIGRVRAVFSWSYTTLSPAAARLFRLLGLHPGPDTTAPAAASLAGLPPAQARGLLAELTRAGLLAETAPGRYGFHDLLRAYAADLTQSLDSAEERETATVRLLDHYVHTAHTADRHLSPVRDAIQVSLAPPAPGAAPEQPTDQQAALEWLDAERPVLLAAQQLAAAAGRDAHAWQLAWALANVLDRRGRWQEWAGAWQAALPAAGRLPHPAAATAHRLLGAAATMLGDDEQAHTHLQHALHLHTDAGDPVGQAHTHHTLSQLWERRGRPDQALDHAQHALTLYQATGHRRGQAHALNAVGWYHALLGDPTRALTYCQQALTLYQQLGNREGEANAWDSLGYAHHHLDHHVQAAACYRHALTLTRDLGDRYEEASTLTRLGDTHHAAGQPGQARTAWATALDILTDLDHPDAGTVRARLATLGQTRPPSPDTGLTRG